jgi:hypothetical protein
MPPIELVREPPVDLFVQDAFMHLIRSGLQKTSSLKVATSPGFFGRMFHRPPELPVQEVIVGGSHELIQPLPLSNGLEIPIRHDPLNSFDLWDAMPMIDELHRSSVPRLFDSDAPHDREVIFDTRDSDPTFLPQIHAMWSVKEIVVLFYYAGVVCSFNRWARTHQPSLHRYLGLYNPSDLVVIIPAILRLDERWLAALKEQRKKIWPNSPV